MENFENKIDSRMADFLYEHVFDQPRTTDLRLAVEELVKSVRPGFSLMRFEGSGSAVLKGFLAELPKDEDSLLELITQIEAICTDKLNSISDSKQFGGLEKAVWTQKLNGLKQLKALIG